MSEVHQSGGRRNRVLTPELELLWRRESRGEVKNLNSPEEKQAHRKKMREKLEAMSESEKATLRGKLQAQWDALPADKKQKLAEKALNPKAGAGKNKGERKAKRKGKGKGKGGKGAAGEE